MYYALVSSVFTYNVNCWGLTTKENMQRIFVIQKRIIRKIFSLNYLDSCSTIFSENRIMTFPAIIVYRSLIFIKANCHNYEKVLNQHNYNTRQRENISVGNNYLKTKKKSPLVFGALAYNSLDNNVKRLPCKKFKNVLKNCLLDEAPYDVESALNCVSELRCLP